MKKALVLVLGRELEELPAVPPGLAAATPRPRAAHSVGCHHIPVAVTGHDPAALS